MKTYAVAAGLLLLPVLAARGAAWEPSPAERDVVLALSARDGAPPCDVLAARLVDPTASLATIVEQIDNPPWVAVRAARCVVQRDDSDARVAAWLARDGWAGIAHVVASALPGLPEARAVRIGAAGLAGPYKARFVAVLDSSLTPSLRRLLEPR